MPQERFTVCTEGLRQLNASREPWSLIKELVQNAWDEAPEATKCDVIVAPNDNGTTIVSVEDNGAGFREISDAWTLMANTPKRGAPTKRGRFNLGEKEIISVALSATVETTGTTVDFPAKGGRETRSNDRGQGTRITVLMPWTDAQAAELCTRLKRFRPTECGLTVNGEEVPRRTPLATCEAVLRTIIQPGPGKPLMHTRRRTTIDILKPIDGESAWIYELGIPIQTTTLGFDVDIGQKVPMPPNRDTVSESYLQDIASETLNAMHTQMSPKKFSDNWVRTAVEDDRTNEDAVRAVKKNRYGSDAVMWSSDKNANMRAAEAGCPVINPRAMSEKERKVMAKVGGLHSAKQKFGRAPEKAKPAPSNEIRRKFSNWIRAIARILELRATVEYLSAPNASYYARCTPSTAKPIVEINTSFCADTWLAQRGPAQLDLIIHELAHALSNTPMEHGPTWGEACSAAGARIADAIARKRLDYDPLVGSATPPAPIQVRPPASSENPDHDAAADSTLAATSG